MALKAYLGATLPAGFDMGLTIDLESYSGEFKPTRHFVNKTWRNMKIVVSPSKQELWQLKNIPHTDVVYSYIGTL